MSGGGVAGSLAEGRLSHLEDRIPALKNATYQKTSEPDGNYNCVAHVFDDRSRPWSPSLDLYSWAFWPDDIPSLPSQSAFRALFAKYGYEDCETGDPEDGYEKIAIFEKHGLVSHVARRQGRGWWSSKLGDEEDIAHESTEAVTGSGFGYGTVTCYMRRSMS